MHIGAVTLREIDTKYYNTVIRLDHILYNQSVLRQPQTSVFHMAALFISYPAVQTFLSYSFPHPKFVILRPTNHNFLINFLTPNNLPLSAILLL